MKNINLGFKIGLINAIKIVFGESQLSGCFFTFPDFLINFLACELSKRYKSDNEFRKFIKKHSTFFFTI